MRTWKGFVLAGLLALFVACGSSGGDSTKSTVCTAGTTQSCLGAGACTGAQACKDDGSGFGACDCGGALPDTGAATDSVVPTDSATTDDSSTPIDSTPTVDAPAGSITPDKLPGLALWLDSTKGVTLSPEGYSATKWADQSPAAQTTRINCVGSGPATCPKMCGLRKVASDTKGGHDAYQLKSTGKIDCYTYSGSYLSVDDHASLQLGTGPFAIFMVVRVRTTEWLDLWGKNSGGASPNGMSIVFDNTKFEVKTTSAAAKLGLTALPGEYRVAVVRGPALRLRVNGATATGSTVTDDLSFAGKPVTLGIQLGGDSPPFSTQELFIADYIVAKGEVSDAQVLGVEEYLKAKHKITF